MCSINKVFHQFFLHKKGGEKRGRKNKGNQSIMDKQTGWLDASWLVFRGGTEWWVQLIHILFLGCSSLFHDIPQKYMHPYNETERGKNILPWVSTTHYYHAIHLLVLFAHVNLLFFLCFPFLHACMSHHHKLPHQKQSQRSKHNSLRI